MASVILTGPPTCPTPCWPQQNSARLCYIPISYCLMPCGRWMCCLLCPDFAGVVGGRVAAVVSRLSISLGWDTHAQWVGMCRGHETAPSSHPFHPVSLFLAGRRPSFDLLMKLRALGTLLMGSGAGNELVGCAGGRVGIGISCAFWAVSKLAVKHQPWLLHSEEPGPLRPGLPVAVLCADAVWWAWGKPR